MGHHTVKSAYRQLVERLNRFPQGAPPTKVFYQILAMLFSEREAELVAQLPIRPFNAARAARNWRLDLDATRRILDDPFGPCRHPQAPAVKQVMASRQVKSRYLERLVAEH